MKVGHGASRTPAAFFACNFFSIIGIYLILAARNRPLAWYF